MAKLNALKNFWLKDRIRQVMIPISAGSEFEMDLDTDHEEISMLLCDCRATIIDDSVVPWRAKYKVQRSFTISGSNGKIEGKAGEKITLNQADACDLMGSLKIIPLDPAAWYPFKLMHISGNVKKMYDSEEEAYGSFEKS